MSVTALDILKAAREYAADPEHIVKTYRNVYEDANGDPTYEASVAARGCLLGCSGIAAHRLGATGTDANDAACDALAETIHKRHGGGHSDSFIAAMAQPHAARLSLYTETIATLEATA